MEINVLVGQINEWILADFGPFDRDSPRRLVAPLDEPNIGMSMLLSYPGYGLTGYVLGHPWQT